MSALNKVLDEGLRILTNMMSHVDMSGDPDGGYGTESAWSLDLVKNRDADPSVVEEAASRVFTPDGRHGPPVRHCYLLDLSVSLQANQRTKTKRSGFYWDEELFGHSYAIYCRSVDVLAGQTGLKPTELGFTTQSKCRIVADSGSVLVYLKGIEEPVKTHSHVPMCLPGQEIERIVTKDINWVLVCESHAFMEDLCQDGVHRGLEDFPGPGLLMTSSGIPDYTSRRFLHEICETLPDTVPVCIYTDGDAWGIFITGIYVYGSRVLAHLAQFLTAHRAQRIGISADDIERWNLKDGVKPCTEANIKKAQWIVDERGDEWDSALVDEARRFLNTENPLDVAGEALLRWDKKGPLYSRYLVPKLKEAIRLAAEAMLVDPN